MRLAIVAALLFGWLAPARAAVYTVGGFTFDEGKTPATVVAVSGDVVTHHSGFVPGPGFDRGKGIGDLYLAGLGDTTPRTVPRFCELGDEFSLTAVESIQLTWSAGHRIGNTFGGDDLVIYENGSAGRPEPYAISLLRVGESTWSDWRYEFADSFTTGGGINAFATGFDLSTFGYAKGHQVAAMRIRNLVAGETVSDQLGQGWVGGAFAMQTGPLGNGGFSLGLPGQYDADITYVAGLTTAPLVTAGHMPEPGTWALLAVAAAALRRRRR